MTTMAALFAGIPLALATVQAPNSAGRSAITIIGGCSCRRFSRLHDAGDLSPDRPGAPAVRTQAVAAPGGIILI